MIDRELVTRKMVLITRDLNAVAPFAQKALDAYLMSATDEVLVECWLERMIGRMIDINYHLITEAGRPPPRDYYESFVQLAPLDVLPPAFASRIAACAGLRNGSCTNTTRSIRSEFTRHSRSRWRRFPST